MMNRIIYRDTLTKMLRCLDFLIIDRIKIALYNITVKDRKEKNAKKGSMLEYNNKV